MYYISCRNKIYNILQIITSYQRYFSKNMNMPFKITSKNIIEIPDTAYEYHSRLWKAHCYIFIDSIESVHGFYDTDILRDITIITLKSKAKYTLYCNHELFIQMIHSLSI